MHIYLYMDGWRKASAVMCSSSSEENSGKSSFKTVEWERVKHTVWKKNNKKIAASILLFRNVTDFRANSRSKSSTAIHPFCSWVYSLCAALNKGDAENKIWPWMPKDVWTQRAYGCKSGGHRWWQWLLSVGNCASLNRQPGPVLWKAQSIEYMPCAHIWAATHCLLPSRTTGTIGAPGTSMKEHLHASKYVKSQPISKSWAVMTCIRLEIQRSSTALSTPKHVRCQVFWLTFTHAEVQRTLEKNTEGVKSKGWPQAAKAGSKVQHSVKTATNGRWGDSAFL